MSRPKKKVLMYHPNYEEASRMQFVLQTRLPVKVLIASMVADLEELLMDTYEPTEQGLIVAYRFDREPEKESLQWLLSNRREWVRVLEVAEAQDAPDSGWKAESIRLGRDMYGIVDAIEVLLSRKRGPRKHFYVPVQAQTQAVGGLIHYHGAPLTPDTAAAQVFAGRHAMVSFAHPAQLPLIADVCQSFVLDNGAFSAWRAGKPITDWQPYWEWIGRWSSHPGFDWFLIPDVIDGDEDANDRLLESCDPEGTGVPIWHLHESLDRLHRLSRSWRRVALGSSGEFAQIKTPRWWNRMAQAMEVICDSGGRSWCKLHGLRMLDLEVFTRFPFASADSTNVARNVGLDSRWTGAYQPVDKAWRGQVLCSRIEAQQSPAVWQRHAVQEPLLLEVQSA